MAVQRQVPGSASSVCAGPPATPRRSSTPSGGTGVQRAAEKTSTRPARTAYGTTIRSPWAWRPSTTGIVTDRSRWSRTAVPVRAAREARVTVIRITSGTSGETGVFGAAQAVRPAGGGDRIGEVARHGQPVPAAVPVALDGAVHGEEHLDAVAYVVEEQLRAGIARVRRGADQDQPRLLDVRRPADVLDRAAADLHVGLPGDPPGTRVGDHPGRHLRPEPGVHLPAVPVSHRRAVRLVQPYDPVLLPHLDAQHGRAVGDDADALARPPPAAGARQRGPAVEQPLLVRRQGHRAEPAERVIVRDPGRAQRLIPGVTRSPPVGRAQRVEVRVPPRLRERPGHLETYRRLDRTKGPAKTFVESQEQRGTVGGESLGQRPFGEA